MSKKKSNNVEVPFRAVYKNLRTGETVIYRFPASWMVTPTIVIDDKDAFGNIVAYTMLVLLYADAILEEKNNDE